MSAPTPPKTRSSRPRVSLLVALATCVLALVSGCSSDPSPFGDCARGLDGRCIGAPTDTDDTRGDAVDTEDTDVGGQDDAEADTDRDIGDQDADTQEIDAGDADTRDADADTRDVGTDDASDADAGDVIGDTDASDTDLLDADATDTDPGDTDPGDADTSDADTLDTRDADSDVMSTPCTGHETPCFSAADSTEDFVCDLTFGLCLQRCATAYPDFEPGECPFGSLCLPNLGAPSCIPSTCSDFRDEDSCSSGATCLPYGNGASFCGLRGSQGEGDRCIPNSEDTAARCDTGLTCVHSVCVPLCAVNGEGGVDCGSAECTDVYGVGTGENDPGVCLDACEPFSTGQCGDLGCRWLAGVGSEWFCGFVEEGLALGDPCESSYECPDGAACVPDLGGARSCRELCPTADTVDDPVAGCGLASGRETVCSGAYASEPSVGACWDACAPYPRSEADCASDETCVPYVNTGWIPVEPLGFCSHDLGTALPGEPCANPGDLGGDCAGFAACLGSGGETGVCHEICDPFSDEPECPEGVGQGTCSGVEPLLGSLAVSLCVDAQPGAVGDRCSNAGYECEEHGTLCTDLGSGPECVKICREGMGDCEDGSCFVGAFPSEAVPPYMGICW